MEQPSQADPTPMREAETDPKQSVIQDGEKINRQPLKQANSA